MKQRRKPTDNRKTFQTLAMISQLGITMVVAIAMPTALGIWLDKRLGTSWITIVMFIVGAMAGVQSVYSMIKRIYDDEGQDKERDSSGEDNRSVKDER